ncbi:MAG: hypothetical protein WD053_11415 [Gracilimonas sp.]
MKTFKRKTKLRNLSAFLIGLGCLLLLPLTTPAQEIEWEGSYGGSREDVARSIQVTNDGGYIVAGYSKSNDGDVSGNNDGYDYWVLKLDGTGSIEWEENYGGSSDDYANSIQITDDGGYIMAGRSGSNDGDVSENHGSFDYWIVKLDGSGNIEWEGSYGGSSNDYANSIQITDDGGYIVAGWSRSNNGDISGNNGFDDYWIVKLDGSGDIQWEENYGGSSNEQANSIQTTDDGGYIVVGWSTSDDGDVSGHYGNEFREDYWIVKLDGSGSIEWEGNYGGTMYDEAHSVQQTDDGGYIVAGESNSDDGDVSDNKGSNFWIVKLDGSGSIEWEENYGGSSGEYAHSIQTTDDGGYIVAGWAISDDGDVSGQHGFGDYWVVKLGGSGNIEWEGNYGAGQIDRAYSIQQIDVGSYIVAGQSYYSSSDDGDVSGNNGVWDYWVVKLSGVATKK